MLLKIYLRLEAVSCTSPKYMYMYVYVHIKPRYKAYIHKSISCWVGGLQVSTDRRFRQETLTHQKSNILKRVPRRYSCRRILYRVTFSNAEIFLKRRLLLNSGRSVTLLITLHAESANCMQRR